MNLWIQYQFLVDVLSASFKENFSQQKTNADFRLHFSQTHTSAIAWSMAYLKSSSIFPEHLHRKIPLYIPSMEHSNSFISISSYFSVPSYFFQNTRNPFINDLLNDRFFCQFMQTDVMLDVESNPAIKIMYA